ncbi:hypothetical protein CHGG_09639 [Chaetomium globosum CBS 148.51]|uniref:Uncharacterized protein n=1 Tax=Chaetomium globosum (strain ATCC 6205 / CBS 148.51 / DSM 1962 / NBRC 6347 / NRRL 1970) TaxID=306901 RepID=Q2GQW5_CHAGB|nr:uncharacterized protein CHGG_09639 [Chaetomium globosum CBS 148.51]EAQ83235.1 hypothetical protein CHGG_09639 [Chaetomium globosum CBS 148.51]
MFLACITCGDASGVNSRTETRTTIERHLNPANRATVSRGNLTYLIEHVRRAAADSINAAFQPVDTGLRRARGPSCATASSNSINGLRYEYEPFDARKRDRIEALISEEEDLLRSIAQLKRRAPAAAASRWGEATRAGMAADEAGLAVAGQRVAEEGAVSGRRALEGMAPLERQDGVEGRFGEAVAGLGRLKRDLPPALTRMERTRVAQVSIKEGGRSGGGK